jgi:hypothetical protein
MLTVSDVPLGNGLFNSNSFNWVKVEVALNEHLTLFMIHL